MNLHIFMFCVKGHCLLKHIDFCLIVGSSGGGSHDPCGFTNGMV